MIQFSSSPYRYMVVHKVVQRQSIEDCFKAWVTKYILNIADLSGGRRRATPRVKSHFCIKDGKKTLLFYALRSLRAARSANLISVYAIVGQNQLKCRIHPAFSTAIEVYIILPEKALAILLP